MAEKGKKSGNGKDDGKKKGKKKEPDSTPKTAKGKEAHGSTAGKASGAGHRSKRKPNSPLKNLRPIEEWLLDYHEMFNPNDFVVHYCPRCGTPPKVFRQLLIELADRTGEDLCLPREEVCVLCNLNLERVCVFGNDPEPDCLDLNNDDF